ncbi:MAG: ATPase P [Candidatus Heteroscillospira sp.]|jgi:hypothetical protein
MFFKPYCLGRKRLSDEELKEDKKNCRRFGPCGVGKKALYLNSFYIERRYYICLEEVKRVYKRVAMSKGGFTGKGMFASMPYLVVEYAGGEKQCNFKYEENVDRMLEHLRRRVPGLPLLSRAGERRLAEKQRRMEEKRAKILSPKAEESIGALKKAAAKLAQSPELAIELSAAAKQKRVYDRSNPAYKWVALSIVLMGAAALAYGLYSLVTHAGFAIYFMLFGLAAIFLFTGANVLPTSRNNRAAVEGRLGRAEAAMEEFLKDEPDFPVPARYAHPGVLYRMTGILEEGRTETVPQAFEMLKSDLKKLNSGVSVEQEEFDEIMAIKPMFLVHDYK